MTIFFKRRTQMSRFSRSRLSARNEYEYTEMAMNNIILPITQYGEGNNGVENIDVAQGDYYTSNMGSNREEAPLTIAYPVYNEDKSIPVAQVISILENFRKN